MASANNAKKGANVRMKRKERKNIAAGQAHIQSTFNNTVVTITDLQGNAVSWCSSGSLNFRGSRHDSRSGRSTNRNPFCCCHRIFRSSGIQTTGIRHGRRWYHAGIEKTRSHPLD